ncbi:hypothetical protein bcgnr5390_07840 [Bacillus luti]
MRKTIGKSCRNKRCFPYVKTPFIFLLSKILVVIKIHVNLFLGCAIDFAMNQKLPF